MRASRDAGVAIALMLCVTGVAACSSATPSPTSGRATPLPARSPASSEAADRSPEPSPSERQGLGADLAIHRIDPAHTDPLLEFASDGASILFSSGRAEDAGPRGSPDLWRIDAGSSAEPELVWRNPERDNAITKIVGDLGTVAFVDMPLTGERAWNLWLIPDIGEDAVLLDTHPGGPDVPSLVPSLSVFQPIVAWTAFDRGPNGTVSQLLVAEAPDWKPRIVQERLADDAELWFPSLYGYTMAYCEVRYSEDRASDERSVHLLELSPPGAEPRRLDTSGLATMPLMADEIVAWKEADPGFNMFNWGKMFQYDLLTDTVKPMSTWPQEYVNYPSLGGRFVAWWGSDASKLGVYDLGRGMARTIETHEPGSGRDILRPHAANSLLVWLFIDGPDATPELRYAFLPQPGSERFDD